MFAVAALASAGVGAQLKERSASTSAAGPATSAGPAAAGAGFRGGFTAVDGTTTARTITLNPNTNGGPGAGAPSGQ
jgi:hypothetical protein